MPQSSCCKAETSQNAVSHSRSGRKIAMVQCLLGGQGVSTRLEQIWGGFAVELQQEDLHRGVVTGLLIPRRTWASEFAPYCSDTLPTPTGIFHTHDSSHTEVTCLSCDPSLHSPQSASCTLSFSDQNLVKMQGL